MNIKTPKDWRKGQTIFNFLQWLNETKKILTEYNGQKYSGRMADPFYIEDNNWDKYYKEFIDTHGSL